jgi:hypothetical protein
MDNMEVERQPKGVSIAFHDPDFDPAKDLIRWL